MAKDKKAAEAKPQKQQPKARKKTTDKWKKKAWFVIVAPEEFERKELGETIVEKPETLIGRAVKISGRDLANQPKKQHIQLKFKVTKVNGNKAETEAVGHEIKESFLRRVVRRRSSKIMSVRNYASSDGGLFKINIVVVTEKKASGAQKAGLRKKTEETAAGIISAMESKKVIDELVFGSVPNKIYPLLKKIFPVKRIEITKSAVVSKK